METSFFKKVYVLKFVNAALFSFWSGFDPPNITKFGLFTKIFHIMSNFQNQKNSIMKKLFFFLVLLTVCIKTYSQSNNTHYWTQVTTTECKANGIAPSVTVGVKKIDIAVAYKWEKTACTEATLKQAIKVPKLKKGYHVAPDGKHYFNTGQVVYQVLGNSCSAQTWTPKEFWVMMQRK